jgi:hypothetical protein
VQDAEIENFLAGEAQQKVQFTLRRAYAAQNGAAARGRHYLCAGAAGGG